jgi:hypothetical protein
MGTSYYEWNFLLCFLELEFYCEVVEYLIGFKNQ